VGLLIPLLALRLVVFEWGHPHFWLCLPMAARSFSGPVAALAWKLLHLKVVLPFSERW
jgi:hypothetical protein